MEPRELADLIRDYGKRHAASMGSEFADQPLVGAAMTVGLETADRDGLGRVAFLTARSPPASIRSAARPATGSTG